MKKQHIMLGALILGVAAGCNKQPVQSSGGSEAEVQAAATAKAEGNVAAKLQALIPRLGGSLLALGDHQLELAIHQDGLVEALLFDGSGKLVSEPATKSMTVELQAKGDTDPKVEIAWDPAQARFVGRADAKAELVPEPVAVTANIGAKAEQGKLTDYALLSTPRYGGTVLAAGKYQTELIAHPDGQLAAFVTNAEGAAVDADAKASLEASVGADPAVKLAWSPAHACFLGRLDSKVKLGEAPIKLALNADGKTHIGGLGRLAVTAKAGHDGAVVMAGEFPVELTVNGEFLEARVLDASGKASADAELGLKVLAGAKADHELALAWHAPCACYRVKVDAGLRLDSSPIRLQLTQRGRLFTGAALSLQAAHDVNLGAKGKLGASAELGGKAPDLDAKATLDPNAKANLGAAAAVNANANANAKANASAKAAADANAAAKTKLDVQVPKPTVSVSKSASASAGADKKGEVKAGVGASFSLGTR